MEENLEKNIGPEADECDLARNEESSAHQKKGSLQGVGLGGRNYLFFKTGLAKSVAAHVWL